MGGDYLAAAKMDVIGVVDGLGLVCSGWNQRVWRSRGVVESGFA